MLFVGLYAIAPTSNGLNGLNLLTHTTLNDNDRWCVLYILSVETICIFLVPALILLTAIYRNPWNFLHKPTQQQLPTSTLIIALMLLAITNIPGINLLSEINTESLLAIIGEDSPQWLNFLKMEAFTENLVSSEMLLINIVCMALIPAICEELFFRGFLQNIAISVFRNIHIAVIVIAMIFSILHGDIFNFVPRFALGVFLGYVYLYSGKIVIPMLAHFLHNALVVCAASQSNISAVLDTIGTTDNKPLLGIASLLILTGFVILLIKKLRTN